MKPSKDEPQVELKLKIASDLSYTEEERWATKKVDASIADIVCALQAGGIDMRGSCSGHGGRPGEIILQDGRELKVHFPK